jgi:hypothetical protein
VAAKAVDEHGLSADGPNASDAAAKSSVSFMATHPLIIEGCAQPAHTSNPAQNMPSPRAIAAAKKSSGANSSASSKRKRRAFATASSLGAMPAFFHLT